MGPPGASTLGTTTLDTAAGPAPLAFAAETRNVTESLLVSPLTVVDVPPAAFWFAGGQVSPSVDHSTV